MTPAFEATATFPARLVVPADVSPSRWPAWMLRLLRPAQPASVDMHDRSTGLYNRSGLLAAANEAAQRVGGKPLSMVVIEFADLQEVYQIYGNVIARKVVARIIRRLRALAGSRGFAGRTGPVQFTVALPATTQDKAIRQIRRVLGKPARVEFDAGDSEIVLVPDLLVDTAEAGTSAQELYRDMYRELARIQKHEMRRLNWLTHERERHSRPMSLPPSTLSVH
jgi:GGDEF domain-containing protein